MRGTESLEVLPVGQEIAWQHHVDRAGDVCTVTLSGDLDLVASGDLRQILADELRRPGTAGLVVDMASVTFMDSTALSVLVHAHNAATDGGQRLTLVTSLSVQRILEVTGLADLLLAPQDE